MACTATAETPPRRVDGGIADLLRRWGEGDRAALGELLAAHLRWLERYARQRAGAELQAKLDASDHAQQIAIAMLRYRPDYRISSVRHFRAVLKRVADSTVRDACSAWHTGSRNVRRERGLLPGREPAVCSTARRPATPPQVATRIEERVRVHRALALLRPAQREILVLREFDGLRFAKIAARLGITESNARQRHKRALDALRDGLVHLPPARRDSAASA